VVLLINREGAKTIFGLKNSLKVVFQKRRIFGQIRFLYLVKYRYRTPVILSKTKYRFWPNIVFGFGGVFGQKRYLAPNQTGPNCINFNPNTG
jgi:hypothetical protein